MKLMFSRISVSDVMFIYIFYTSKSSIQYLGCQRHKLSFFMLTASFYFQIVDVNIHKLTIVTSSTVVTLLINKFKVHNCIMLCYQDNNLQLWRQNQHGDLAIFYLELPKNVSFLIFHHKWSDALQRGKIQHFTTLIIILCGLARQFFSMCWSMLHLHQMSPICILFPQQLTRWVHQQKTWQSGTPCGS